MAVESARPHGREQVAALLWSETGDERARHNLRQALSKIRRSYGPLIVSAGESLSLDLDDKWSYLRTHGDAEWKTLPTYLDFFVPRLLRFLAERELQLTVFVVGQDAELEAHEQTFEALGQAGHEIGNHSYRHEPWLHLYTPGELEDEIEKAERAIERATGSKPL